ncbi:DNA polymerase III subunit alpha [Candidatus Cryosericum septentrionale]|jgi:error-prone DNA polymerase|uniref:DNA polymerase III subunit alpha n=1 Tax=Candidatus Cryosericum septentrionale TaxID=2290913 RepID=A0A398DIQ3_9BACT|nr:DNA polymerase III subunit alpha [Candidatus Cryosericum septentrionale]RIE15452.1 DNA polymerase III subunit alpha [Candidatus Cryosericum septentrionale]
MSFVHLHLHTGFSFHESPIRIEDLAQRSRELGYSSCAITDSNTLAGAIRFDRAARSAGVTPVFGSELTLLSDEPDDHVVVLARDLEGYRNLCRLVTCTQAHGRVHPGLTLEQLASYAGHLVALYGSPESLLYQSLSTRHPHKARRLLEQMSALFENSLYLDVQNPMFADSTRLLYRMRRLSDETGVPACATGGVTHLHRVDAEVREMLLAIGSLEDVDARSRQSHVNAESWFRGSDEIQELFTEWPEALATSGRIAAECRVELPLDGFKTPSSVLTATRSLRDIVYTGAREKYGIVTTAVEERIEHELSIIRHMHMDEYFLIVRDIIEIARRKGVAYSGRGSGTNSIVCYCIDATQVDPIQYNLLFERFLNEGRKSLPDVDIDFDALRRDEVVSELFAVYGEDRVCRVANVNTYNIRGAFRDVGKALGYSKEEVDDATRLLPWYSHRRISEVIAKLPELATFPYGSIERWISLAERIMGLPRTLSTHLAGLIIAPFPLTDLIPLEPSGTGCLMTQYDKDDVERLGLVKMDLLGLRTLSAAVDATAMIQAETGTDISLSTIPMDDQPTYRLLREARTLGVFQLESPGMRNLLLKLQPVCYTDIMANVSLFRPGPMAMNMDKLYLARRNGKVPVTFEDPRLEPVLKETYGVIVFQEQVLQVANTVADLSLSEADVLRRTMTEHTPKAELARFERLFLERAAAKGTNPETAQHVYNQLKGFASYGFNKGHAASFGLLAYRTAYLKTHWPAQYTAGLLNAMPVGFYPPFILLDEARRCHILIKKPLVTCSMVRTTAHGMTVQLGLSMFSTLSAKDAISIVTAREKRPFNSTIDFMDRTWVNRRALQHLVLAGAFDDLGTPVTVATDLGLDPNEIERVMNVSPNLRLRAILGEIAGIGYPVSASLAVLLDLATADVMDAPTPVQARAPALRSTQLRTWPHGSNVWVRGVVVRIQTPPTKSGKRVFFITLEDEDGMVEAVMFEDAQRRYAAALKQNRMMRLYGELQNTEGSPTVLVKRLEGLRFIPRVEETPIGQECA